MILGETSFKLPHPFHRRRFVATAAHCVCMSSSATGEESLVDCEGGEIKYDAAKVIEVFVGLNTQDINVAIERNRDLHQRQVEKVRKVQGESGGLELGYVDINSVSFGGYQN